MNGYIDIMFVFSSSLDCFEAVLAIVTADFRFIPVYNSFAGGCSIRFFINLSYDFLFHFRCFCVQRFLYNSLWFRNVSSLSFPKNTVKLTYLGTRDNIYEKQALPLFTHMMCR